MIVIIPQVLAGNLKMAHRVYWMGIREECDILYLVLVDQPADRMRVTLRSATMTAGLSGSAMDVDFQVVDRRRWLKALRAVYRPGDRMICHKEQMVKTGLTRFSPLEAFLKEKFSARVTALEGYYDPRQDQIQQWGKSLLFWAVTLLILAGFFALEWQSRLWVHGWAHKLILALLNMLEIGSVVAWSKVFLSLF